MKQIIWIFVRYIFSRIRVPIILGYLFTGIIACHHLLSLVGAGHEIELMAEIGVVLLLFTIGMEYSLTLLMRIRKIVFVGEVMQVLITATMVESDSEE